MTRAIVLGGGVAGLAAADMLCRAGRSVRVIEASDRLGGAHRSHTIGPYTFDVGSIFYEETAPLLDLAPGLRDLCPQMRRVQRRLSPGGDILHYPFEPSDLLRWSRGRQARGIIDLLAGRAMVRQDGTLDAICRRRLGGTIFRETGLKSYIERFSRRPATEIDEAFFFDRMKFIDTATRGAGLKNMLGRALRRRSIPRAPLRLRPPAGFDALFGPIRRTLEARGVEFALSETVDRIEKIPGGHAVITDRNRHEADMLVGTLPLDTLHRALFDAPSGLASLDMLTLFVSCRDLGSTTGNVLFNFHGEGRWKRATIYSRLYPEMRMDRDFMSVEITLGPDQKPDPTGEFDAVARQFSQLGLAADLKLEGHAIVPHAYPLYTPGYRPIAEAAIARIAAAGILPAGRQGRFEYLPTSSGVIRRVGEVLSKTTKPAAAPSHRSKTSASREPKTEHGGTLS